MALTSPRFARNNRLQRASENNPPLTIGESNEAVRIVQMALIDLGFPMPISTAGGTKLPDGIFGDETAGTIRSFQQANGLIADGIVGRNTLARLESLTVVATEQQARADALKTRQRTTLA
jgi:peptidoglycan hydrolase-like protein with peptidoglycan-binding domain